MKIESADRERCMKTIQQLVQQKYYDPSFGGHDWAAISESHRPSVIAAGTTDEFEAATNSMLKELGSGALGLLGAASKIGSRNAICASFRSVETRTDGQRWVFQDVAPGGPADLAGIHPGDALLDIAGQRGLATIVGTPTPGRLISHRGFEIGNGYTLVIPVAAYVSWEGKRLDGKGIQPDVPAEWSYEAATAGADQQMEHAVACVDNR